ncbi:helix-turn-helix domain-containing protein [Streptomyces sp. NPDC096311]|uniref:helix-turn-helix domain-containing protein n=1 Tax=Streptomyces sp. NPDC096311 TaxID=3366083 RepID=UPI0038229AE0
MPNYDAQSDEKEADEFAEYAKHTEAVSHEVDEHLEPTDPIKNATRGQLGDAGDMERLASFNLRRIRQALGLSQQQVADKLAERPDRVRLSQSQLAKMERGERPWRVNELWDIADALGIQYMEFFSGQMREDSPELQVLAARLKYQAAWEEAGRVEEDYKKAVRKALEAGRKLVHTAAHFGVKDDHAMHILAAQASRAEEVEYTVKDINSDRPLISREELKERHKQMAEETARHEAWAEEEWKRLTLEIEELKKKQDEDESL